MKKILMSLVLLSISLCAGSGDSARGVGAYVVRLHPTSKQQIIDLCTKFCPQTTFNGVENRNEPISDVIKSCIDKASSELGIK